MKGEYRALRKGLDQLDTAVDNAFGAGPYVVAEYSVIGTQLTPLGWVPLQHDRLLQFSRVDIVELRAGKIARVWRYSNPTQVIEKP